MTYSLVQGLTSGGTATFLHSRLQRQSEKSSKSWETIALQVNHLLLLSAENLVLAGSPLGVFGSVVRAAPLLGLAAVGLNIHQKDQGMPFSSEHLDLYNNAYRVGVIASSVATLALGSPVFAAASISMIAIDMVASGDFKDVFDVVKKVAALFSAIGYGMQIFSSEHILAIGAKVAAIVIPGKIILNDLLDKEEDYSSRSIVSYQGTGKNSTEAQTEDTYSKIPLPIRNTLNKDLCKTKNTIKKSVVSPIKKNDKISNPTFHKDSSTDSSKANIFCRASVW